MSGYTLVALGYNGKARTVRPGTKPFKLTPPESDFTLQLINAHGIYAGPVVVSVTQGGQRVIEGVKAGASLGTINVLFGYARLARPLAKKWLDTGRWAQAKRGVPIGNGRNFGLVRSKLHNGPGGPGGDTSRTGVPNAISVDPEGDGRIDALKSAGLEHARAAQVSPGTPAVASQLKANLQNTVNANASAVTTADIDALLVQDPSTPGVQSGMDLLVFAPSGDIVELDCTGLSYCQPGGTGLTSTGQPFPSCCDPSGDGFGRIVGPGAAQFPLIPRATSEQIGSGDTFLYRVTTAGTLTEIPGAVPFVFDTVPALISYTDGAGSSGTITYPASAGSPGTPSNPIPVSRNVGGAYVLTGTFWRPQRQGIAGAGEPPWMDIGGLTYAVIIGGAQGPGGPQGPPQCPSSSLSTTDPNLAPPTGGQIGTMADQKADAPANPANTLTFTVNISDCLAAKGESATPATTVNLGIEAREGGEGSIGGFAEQQLVVLLK